MRRMLLRANGLLEEMAKVELLNNPINAKYLCEITGEILYAVRLIL